MRVTTRLSRRGVFLGESSYIAALLQESIKNGMSREFGKEILKCFWLH